MTQTLNMVKEDPVSASDSGVSLLFGPERRPGVEDIVAVLESAGPAGVAAHVSHRPEPSAGWLELVTSGLTFDIEGLAPAAAVGHGEVSRTFGMEGDHAVRDFVRVQLSPSTHVSAGAGLQPIVRALAALAADLVLRLPVAGVIWHPARTLMEPAYFARLTLGWLAGGLFPAQGLTALTRHADGSITTRGLSLFTGQEMRLEGRQGESAGDAINLAARAIHHLVGAGKLQQRTVLGSGPEALIAEPSQVGDLVLVWRGERPDR